MSNPHDNHVCDPDSIVKAYFQAAIEQGFLIDRETFYLEICCSTSTQRSKQTSYWTPLGKR
jgi:NAD(P)H-flavin reductase